MQRAMTRLDGFLRHRQRWVLGAWIVLLLAAVPFALRQSDNLSGGGFATPGSQSQAIQDELARDYPQVSRSSLAVLLDPTQDATPAQLRAGVGRVADAARKTDHVTLSAASRERALTDADRGRPVLVALHTDLPDERASDAGTPLREELHVNDGARDGVVPHIIGPGGLWAGMQDLSKRDLASAEATGFPIVLLILLVVFGSFAAAALPLALGIGSVMLTGAVIYFLSQAMDMSVFVTNMASMIGIGVAVDYSLFVLARYREEIHAGRDRDSARAAALATSGVAVAFSGLTVIVSLAGLWMVDNAAIRSMSLGAIIVVAVSVLASATLLPVLIRVMGHRAYARGRIFVVPQLLLRSRARRRPGSTRPDVRPEHSPFWSRWTASVMGRPVLSVVGAAAVLLVLAIPTLSMKTGNGALRQFPAGEETRVGMERAAALTSPGEAQPTQVLLDYRSGRASDPGNRKVLRDVSERVRRDPLIAGLRGVRTAQDGRSQVLFAAPRTDGESDAAKAMVERLRAGLPAVAGQRAEVAVGGMSAAQKDLKDLIASSMWKIILFVLGLSFLVLMALLRSVVIPLKAVLMNLLSVGAAYGVLVAVFQWGWIDGFAGFQSPGYVDTLTPPLVLAVVFGLSMDYEVFLLSRIRERYQITGDTRRAVAEGLASSARTITSAALIMVAVFSVFIGTGVSSIKEIGLGNAVAIALDATLVRLILVPAAMELLGAWNWWLPGPLARLLPRSSFERPPEPAAA